MQAAAQGQPVPDDGYHGALHRRPRAGGSWPSSPGSSTCRRASGWSRSGEAAYALQLAEQQEQLDSFRTHFDVWFSERSLHDESAVTENIEKLRGQGHLFDEDGALWMRTTDAGDDKDRVLIRSNGELTYFASDTAYYLDKRGRGFDVCIYLLGADHHGYVAPAPGDGGLRR